MSNTVGSASVGPTFQAQKHMKKLCTKNSDYKEDPCDVVSRQCKELDEWRDKYHMLLEKYHQQIDLTSSLVADCDAWREKYRELDMRHKALQTSHDDIIDESAKMSEELVSVRSECVKAMKKHKDAEQACSEKAEQLREAEQDIKIIKKSNELLADELKRVRRRCDSLGEQVNAARDEVMRMRHRNIIARILNK